MRWVGTIYKLSTNGDGKGTLEIQLNDKTWVKTWNKKFSDSLDGGQTLIDPDSALFTTVSALHEGDYVRFTGNFMPSKTDCFEEPSMTIEGSMTEPEFIMRFADVRALSDA